MRRWEKNVAHATVNNGRSNDFGEKGRVVTCAKRRRKKSSGIQVIIREKQKSSSCPSLKCDFLNEILVLFSVVVVQILVNMR